MMDPCPHVVEDQLGLLQLYSDGSITRCTDAELFERMHFPAPNSGHCAAVVWKDCLYDAAKNLRLRLYKPTEAAAERSPAETLPVLYFLHGGGFCFGSREWPNIHGLCLRLAAELGALVVSPDHRLAPEHRLPAAVDDLMGAVLWLGAQANGKPGDAWLDEGVDFDRVFIMGDSSGGNLAHQLAIRIGSGSVDTRRVRVRGYIMLAPFFGGTVRTRSEEGPAESRLNVEQFNRLWRLSLPIGVDMDHPLANPVGPGSPNLEWVEMGRVLVVAGELEIMRDRVKDYATKLKEMGKQVEYVEFKGHEHGFYVHDHFSDATNILLQLIEQFINQ